MTQAGPGLNATSKNVTTTAQATETASMANVSVLPLSLALPVIYFTVLVSAQGMANVPKTAANVPSDGSG